MTQARWMVPLCAQRGPNRHGQLVVRRLRNCNADHPPVAQRFGSTRSRRANLNGRKHAGPLPRRATVAIFLTKGYQN